MKFLPARMSSGRAITLGAVLALSITVLALDPPGRGNHRRVRNSTCETTLEDPRARIERGREDGFVSVFAECTADGWRGDPRPTPEAVASCITHRLRELDNPWDRTQRAYLDGYALGVSDATQAERQTQACQVTLVPTTLDGRPAIALFQRRPGLIRDTREWLIEPVGGDPAAPASPTPGRGGVR